MVSSMYCNNTLAVLISVKFASIGERCIRCYFKGPGLFSKTGYHEYIVIQ